MPQNVAYYGKTVTIANGSDPTKVTFHIAGYDPLFHVNWNNNLAVWLLCSTVTRQNGSTGVLYLSVAWCQANGVGQGAQDPKIPLSLGGIPLDYRKIEVMVTDVKIDFSLVDDPNKTDTVSVFDTQTTLPFSVRPQVAFEFGAKGDLWLTENELGDKSMIDYSKDPVTWPDVESEARQLLAAGAISASNGAVQFHPNTEEDVHRLSALLLHLKRRGRTLGEVLGRVAEQTADPETGTESDKSNGSSPTNGSSPST